LAMVSPARRAMSRWKTLGRRDRRRKAAAIPLGMTDLSPWVATELPYSYLLHHVFTTPSCPYPLSLYRFIQGAMTFTPGDAAAFEATIISACDEHERASRWKRGYRRCLVIEGFFIKFDSYRSLYPQVETQKYVFRCAKDDISAPRVPEVLHFFHRDYRMAYVVMEYIKFTPPPVPDLPKKAALALQWLRDLPAPPDCPWIGPLGGGRVRHRLFKDYEAPLSFVSIQAIERYLNTVCAYIVLSIRHPRIHS